ncbi:MAG: hypothetical protein WBF09_20740, partial [Candidatus Acidiferrum sp.]
AEREKQDLTHGEFREDAKKRRVEAGAYRSGEQASRSALKIKTPRQSRGVNSYVKKCITTTFNCQEKSAKNESP